MVNGNILSLTLYNLSMAAVLRRHIAFYLPTVFISHYLYLLIYLSNTKHVNFRLYTIEKKMKFVTFLLLFKYKNLNSKNIPNIGRNK